MRTPLGTVIMESVIDLDLVFYKNSTFKNRSRCSVNNRTAKNLDETVDVAGV